MDEHPVVRSKWRFDLETYFQNLLVPTFKVVDELKTITTFSRGHNYPITTSATDEDVTIDINIENLEKHWSATDDYNSDSRDIFAKIRDALTGRDIPAPEEARKKRPEGISEMVPKFKLNKMGLGFFLTTNLLGPGAKVIQIDQKAGPRFPAGMLLVGRVVEGYDSVKFRNL
ncbi:hypothetical protein BDW62DRAFT_201369 [Aspergillus aurantiobrunneus]